MGWVLRGHIPIEPSDAIEDLLNDGVVDTIVRWIARRGSGFMSMEGIDMRRIGVTLWLMMLVAGSALAQVRTEHAEGTDFSKFKTFMWIMEPNATNPLTTQRIVDGVNAALAGKGLRLVTSDADLAIAAHAMTETERTLRTFYDGFGGGWRWRESFGSSTTTEITYMVGTLVVDLFDARTKAAVWRGTAMRTLSDNPQKRAEDLKSAIGKMFKNFPPARLRG